MARIHYFRPFRSEERSMTSVTENYPIEGLLTVLEAAAWLRVNKWTVYNLIRNGQLQTIKIGRRRLVSRAALATCVTELGKEAA